MTREKAIKNHVRPKLCKAQCEHIVNSIYDDFKSRTCSNCKYYAKSIHMCDNGDSFAKQYFATVLDTDGCNKWEAKDAN